MKIVFKSEDYAALNFERHYVDGFAVNEKNGFYEIRTEIDYMGIKNKTQRIYCPGIICSLIYGSLENELVQHIRSDFPYLQMHFELSSTACFYFPKEKFSPVTDIIHGTHCLLFYPALNGNLHYMKKPTSLSVEIELSLDFLRRIFHDDLEVLHDFGKSIERNLPAVMGNQSHPITPQMKEIIFEIRDCPYAGSLKKIFVEAKIIELLTLQISQINAQQPKTLLKKADIDKLHDIRDIVLANIYNPYSIEELAKLAGMNRTKLQQGFKHLFGTTVFDYLTNIRLEKARQLMLDGDYAKIAEVSSEVGYKNHQHFTTAFKRKYGYLPKELKRFDS